MIQRDMSKLLKNDLGKHKALVIMGARQVGKRIDIRPFAKTL